MSDGPTFRHWLAILLLGAATAGMALAVEGPLFDPTRPSGYLEPASPGAADDRGPADQLRFGGIFTGPEGTAALLNGRRLQAGDQLGDLRVIAVEQDAVVVERGGATQRIGIEVTPVKRPSDEGTKQ